MSTDLAHQIGTLRLVDHHVHSSLRAPVTRQEFETLITESDRPIPAGTTTFDSQVGFAIRRHCAPLLGAARHASPDEYWRVRASRTPAELTQVFLTGSGTVHWLVDTGFMGDRLTPLAELADLTRTRVSEVVRLEAVLEDIAPRSTAAGLERDFRAALADATSSAIGLKSVVAYRHGFDIDAARPSAAEVTRAAAGWLDALRDGSPPRVTDPVLLRMILWAGVDTGLPLQLHAGFGDPDLDLRRSDPLLLAPWIKAVESRGTDIVLLHCYPFHRNAGFLAHAFPHVYFDVGLALNYSGAAAAAVVAESLELAPFAKILYSSDAWGPPELHYLGAVLWRAGMTRTLTRWVAEGEWCESDAVRVATMIGRTNAQRLYGLSDD